MNDLTKNMSVQLPILAEQINRAHQEVQSALRQGVSHALDAGRVLLEAKQLVGHGGWGRWVSENCAFSERTSRVYMQLARDYPTLDESNRQRVAVLPLREAMKLLAEPDLDPELALEEGRTIDVEIDKVIIGNRFRKNMGDLWRLAESIRAIGLLQPILINRGMLLLCGYRRLLAFRLLGRKTIEAVISSIHPIDAQFDENEAREHYIPSERIAIGQSVEKRLGQSSGWPSRR